MGNLMNIPEIRFPEFKDDWEHKELNELLSESKKKNDDLRYSKEEVLSVSGELGIVNQIEHLGRSYAGVSVHNYGVVEVGDIVYTKSPLKANPYGIIKINKGKAGIVSTLYAVYKVNEKTAYGDFLDYYFSLDANTNRYLRPLVRKGAKNDMKINNEYVLHDRIYAPLIPEQKRIANFFTVLDNKINQLDYFNDSVSSKNLLGYYLIEKNDFAYNRSYSKGYPMGATKRLIKYEKGVVSTLYICFRFKKDIVIDYFEHYFESGLANREIEKYAQEGARNHGLLNIGLNDYFSIYVLFPEKKEQTKIANFLSKIDDKIKTVNEQIEETKEYKKGLLQRMYIN
jgi:restriction endonuclease S subunit